MSDDTQLALDALQADVAALAAQLSAFLAALPTNTTTGLTDAQLAEVASIDAAVKAIAGSLPAPVVAPPATAPPA